MCSDYDMIAEKLDEGVEVGADVAIAWLKYICKDMIEQCEALGIDEVGVSVADMLGDIELIRSKGWKRVKIVSCDMTASGVDVIGI